MSISILTVSLAASAAIGPNIIAQFTDGANSNEVGPATGNTAPLVGTTGTVGASEAGQMVDLDLAGIGDVQLGAAVNAGDALTSDANGKAIATTTAGDRIIGFAHEPGAVDEIIKYRAAPGVIGSTV